jgi:hypothetical protein
VLDHTQLAPFTAAIFSDHLQTSEDRYVTVSFIIPEIHILEEVGDAKTARTQANDFSWAVNRSRMLSSSGCGIFLLP